MRQSNGTISGARNDGRLIGVNAVTETLATLLIGIFIGCAGKYFADKYTDKRRGREKKQAVSSDLQYVTERMPELIGKMQADLKAHPLCREFILLSKRSIYRDNPNKKVLRYYFEDHDDLAATIDILENLGFVDNITFNNTQRYCVREHFADLLL